MRCGGNQHYRRALHYTYYKSGSLLECMTTLSRGKEWGNDGGLCGRGGGGWGGVGEAMKGMRKDRKSGSLQLTDRGFSLIRWGICRRHTDQPTAHFYDPQSSFASISRSFTPHPSIPPSPLPCFHGPGQRGWDVVIYTSVHVCVSCVCVHVWSNEAVPPLHILHTHITNLLEMPDYRQK